MKNKKSIEQILSLLPEKEKNEAIHNFNDQLKNTDTITLQSVLPNLISVADCLTVIFVWSKTKEGFPYWNKIFNDFKFSRL